MCSVLDRRVLYRFYGWIKSSAVTAVVRLSYGASAIQVVEISANLLVRPRVKLLRRSNVQPFDNLAAIHGPTLAFPLIRLFQVGHVVSGVAWLPGR